MAKLEEHRRIVENMNKALSRTPTFEQLQTYFSEAMYIHEDCPKSKFCFDVSRFAKEWCQKLYTKTKDERYWYLYWDILKFEAPYLLDSYCIYIERNRPPKERFYMPRRRTLKQIVDLLQRLEDNELDEIFIHQPPRTGKTMIITMATCWHICRDMEHSNLYVTYKEGLGGSFLDGVMEILTDPTYLHNEIFPNTVIADTNSKDHKLDLGRKKKYKTLSGKGLESGLNGEYDAYGWLIVDDPLEGIADVLNEDVLRRKKIIFTNNVLSRKKESCKVIYNGTIWSLHDIFSERLDFLKTDPNSKDVRYEVLKIPALNPETDESNFDYDYGVGFSTNAYRRTRASFEANDDMASWFAQYQQEPIERDGAVFNPEYMNFYDGNLPDEGHLVRVCAACDVALGGTDFLSMPVAYIYDDDSVYIHDVVFNSSEKDVTQPEVVEALIANDVGSAFFESNQGGELYKDDIERQMRQKGKRIAFSSRYAPTNKRKEQRIWDEAPRIRQFYYRDDSCRNDEYRKFMVNLFSFTMNGRNKHDDAPDSLATLADFIDAPVAKATKIIRSPI